MKRIKHHFFPQQSNNHHAPMLHRKRHVLFGAVAVCIKGIVLLVAVLLPLEVFVTKEALNAQIKEIVVETNILREANGIEPLTEHPLLLTSSEQKSADMRDNQYFGHMSPEGKRVGDLLRDVGYEYRYAGENLAIGFSTAKDVVAAWEASSLHYRNMVHPVFTNIGVGVSVDNTNGNPVPYFVQHFGVQKNDPQLLVVDDFVEDNAVYVLPQSQVFWKEVGGAIRIEPQIFISQPVKHVVITQFDRDVILLEEHDIYTVEAMLDISKKHLFDPVLPVSIRIETLDGEIIESLVPFNTPPIIAPTAYDRYLMAVAYVDDITPLIMVSRAVLLTFIGILMLSLFMHLLWSIHEKKHTIVFESTLFLLVLIVLLVF